MRQVVLPLALLLSLPVLSQSNGIETRCDTIVFGRPYNTWIRDARGRSLEFGNRNEMGDKHGWWIELGRDSASSHVREYHNGLKIHERWRHGELWRIDEKGNILSKGKADRRVKKTF